MIQVSRLNPPCTFTQSGAKPSKGVRPRSRAINLFEQIVCTSGFQIYPSSSKNKRLVVISQSNDPCKYKEFEEGPYGNE